MTAKLGDLCAGCALRRAKEEYVRKGQEFLKSSVRFARLESAFLEATTALAEIWIVLSSKLHGT